MAKQNRVPDPSDATVLHVYTAAAGRCSFFGCLNYVMQERLTGKRAILGNVAHIVAASRDGARGDHPLALSERSKFDNLMLMCREHHDFIDKKESALEYSVERLRKQKKGHESLMKVRTGIPTDDKTFALRLFGQVREKKFNISDPQINLSVFRREKRYLDEKRFEIDLINTPDVCASAYWEQGKKKIDETLVQQVFPMIEDGRVDQMSIFALARIPLLAYLGFRLGDKVPVTLYQKHKDDGEGWAWPRRAPEYQFERIDHGGTSVDNIAVLISVSGGKVEDVRAIAPESRLYEIRPVGVTPTHTLLSSHKTLENFRHAYKDFLSEVESKHPRAKRIDCFIAGPAPVAIICGRELRREDPKVVIYDRDERNLYKKTITLP